MLGNLLKVQHLQYKIKGNLSLKQNNVDTFLQCICTAFPLCFGVHQALLLPLSLGFLEQLLLTCGPQWELVCQSLYLLLVLLGEDITFYYIL